MNILCAPWGLVALERPGKGIADIATAGFEGILLDMAVCCPAEELDYSGRERKEPEKLHNRLIPLLEECEKQHIRIVTARAPYPAGNSKWSDLGELLSRLAEESIRVCGKTGCRHLIVQPLSSGGGRECEWEINRKYYLGLADMAKRNNVTILLQNQARDLNGHWIRGICSDAGEAASWVDRLNADSGEERFGFCMDTGVCSLCGQDMREYAAVLGNRIKAVILRECDGYHDTSMLPFTCVNRGQAATDWLGAVRGLRETGFDGPLIMEFGTTAAAFSQILRPQFLKLAGACAKYFRWQISMKNVLKKYDSRVLFGAGNMCRNYMKCYGEEFPPLFTCDNNGARWGERFEGLEIKPPESLKELPPDCAVFICNIYYREIERQLREMGIVNPIEYFNDEYMPSYYFDRLEYWEGEA